MLLPISFLSAAESALFHLPKAARERFQERGSEKYAVLDRLLRDPKRLTLTLRVTNLASRVVLVALTTLLSLRLASQLSVHPAFSLAVHLAVLILLVVGPGEAVPRAYGITNSERVTLAATPALQLLMRTVGPPLGLLVSVLKRVAGRLGVRWAIPYLTAEEVLAVVEVGEEKGKIEEEEREMIHSIFELAQTAVREIMVPRVDMVAVERSSTVREALERITSQGHSRVPVYEERIDKIVGVVYAKDILRNPDEKALDLPVESVMREPFFVPEGKRVDDLMREFQREKVHLAIVVDEYGGTAGLVTLEDVLEEIVGEIEDEYDREDVLFEKVGPDTAVVNAKIPIDDLNERFSIGLPADRHDTLGGYLYDLVDRVPEEGESFEDELLRFTVEKVDRQRIARVRIRKLPLEEGNGAEKHAVDGG